MLWAWALVPTNPPGACGVSKEVPRGTEERGVAACLRKPTRDGLTHHEQAACLPHLSPSPVTYMYSSAWDHLEGVPTFTA
eukprot:SAG25_NODE_90_length_16264_cov_230.399876_6_plen_80_part_00